MQVELAAALQAAAGAEAERERSAQQLRRLKDQMLREQEDEESELSWRVEAEVRFGPFQSFEPLEMQRVAETRFEIRVKRTHVMHLKMRYLISI